MQTSTLVQKTVPAWLPFSLLITLGFIWGTGYSLARFATTHAVTPLGYSFWQSLGPAGVISLFCWLIRNKGADRSSSSALAHWPYYLIYGLSGIAIPNTNMYFASPHLPAGILAMVVNTVPIMAYLMALAARIERFRWSRFLGIGCAALGIGLIILPQAGLPQPGMIPWVLISLLTPLSFAFCSVYIACSRPSGSHSLLLSAGTLIASSLLLAPLVFHSDGFYFFHYPLTVTDGIVLLEILLSSMGYVLFFQLIKMAGPVYYSMVDTIVVLTGLFWGYLIFGETLNGWTGGAVVLILAALGLVTRGGRKEMTS